MTREIDNETMVCLFDGHKENPLDRGEPEWTGTLFEFWTENEDAYSTEEIYALRDDLARAGETYLGGGAQPQFTLVLYGNT